MPGESEGTRLKLDPKKVRFSPPFLDLGIFSVGLRFIGKENSIHLLETALAVEGNLLKVGLMGLEVLFRRALAEWSSVTIPYSRIEKARFGLSPLVRVALLVVAGLPWLVGAALLAVNVDTAVLTLICAPIVTVPALYVMLRIRARYTIVFRAKNGRRTRLTFRIASAPLRAEFERRLNDYRRSAARFAVAN